MYRKYTRFAFPIFFYVPIILTIVLSVSVIFLLVQKRKSMKNHLSDESSRKRRKKENNAVLQLTLIVLSFIIGYIPFTAFEFRTSIQHNDTYENWWIDWHFGTAQYMFLRLSECLNPIFYNLGSKTLWNETKKLLSKSFPCVFKNITSYTTTTSFTPVTGKELPVST